MQQLRVTAAGALVKIFGTTEQIVTIVPNLGYIARMRIRLLALSLTLLAAACGGADAVPETTRAPAATTAPSASETSAPATETTATQDSTENADTTTTTTEALRAEAPIAPAFVTTLSDGSQFDMGAHDRPVYLVFWAEW